MEVERRPEGVAGVADETEHLTCSTANAAVRGSLPLVGDRSGRPPPRGRQVVRAGPHGRCASGRGSSAQLTQNGGESTEN